MPEIILTNRPVELKKPISWANGITRVKSKHWACHIAMRKDGIVYESTAGKGVQMVPFTDWCKGREGTTLFIYFDLPEEMFDWGVFDTFYEAQTGYDYKANILYLFNMISLLEKKNKKRQFCSELVGNVIKEYMIKKEYKHQYERPFNLTPGMIELDLRDIGKLVLMDIH